MWIQYHRTPCYHGDLIWSNPVCVCVCECVCAPAGRDPSWCLALSSAAWPAYVARPASWFLWAGFPFPGLNPESPESPLARLPVTTETRLGSETKLFSGGSSAVGSWMTSSAQTRTSFFFFCGFWASLCTVVKQMLNSWMIEGYKLLKSSSNTNLS